MKLFSFIYIVLSVCVCCASEAFGEPVQHPLQTVAPVAQKDGFAEALKRDGDAWLDWTRKAMPIAIVLYMIPLPLSVEGRMMIASGIVLCLILHDAFEKFTVAFHNKGITFPQFQDVGSTGMKSLASSMKSFGSDGLVEIAQSSRFGVISFSAGALISLAVVSMLQGQMVFKVAAPVQMHEVLPRDKPLGVKRMQRMLWWKKEGAK